QGKRAASPLQCERAMDGQRRYYCHRSLQSDRCRPRTRRRRRSVRFLESAALDQLASCLVRVVTLARMAEPLTARLCRREVQSRYYHGRGIVERLARDSTSCSRDWVRESKGLLGAYARRRSLSRSA